MKAIASHSTDTLKRKAENVARGQEIITVQLCDVLAEYFQSCPTRAFSTNNVSNSAYYIGFDTISNDTRYNYQRRQERLRGRASLRIWNLPVLEVSKNPDSAILLSSVLTRSDAMRPVYKGLKRFIRRHLGGVELTDRPTNTGRSLDAPIRYGGLPLNIGVIDDASFFEYVGAELLADTEARIDREMEQASSVHGEASEYDPSAISQAMYNRIRIRFGDDVFATGSLRPSGIDFPGW